MVKSGKVGIDLYFIIFGVTAALFIPLYFLKSQWKFKRFWQSEVRLTPEQVADLEHCPYDIDELSIKRIMFADHLLATERKNSKVLALKEDIRDLMNQLYANK